MRINKKDSITVTMIKDVETANYIFRKPCTGQSVYLNKMGSVLEKLDQNPSVPVMEALKPFIKRLVSDSFLKNDDIEMQVSVARCFTELTRITAATLPYEEEKMKEPLRLCVKVFENLLYPSGRYYEKSISMLNKFAKVRMCLIMLDLGMKEEIAKMFRIFFDSAAGRVELSVLSIMEVIMTTVITESDDDELPMELIELFLKKLKVEAKSNLQCVWRLCERILDKCFDTLKNYIPAAELRHIHPTYFAETIRKGSSGKRDTEVNELAPGHAKVSGSTSVTVNDENVNSVRVSEEHDEHGQKSVQCERASSEIIEVNGYKVKARNARILKEIMSKYGDITSVCSYKSIVLKSSMLDTVCDTVQRLHNIITEPADLNELETIIDDMDAAKVKIGWLKTELENRKAAEQNRVILRGISRAAKAAEITINHRKAELATAEQRFVEAKRSFEALKCVKAKVEADLLRNQTFLGKRSRSMI